MEKIMKHGKIGIAQENKLNEDLYIAVCRYLDNDSILNFMTATEQSYAVFRNSSFLLAKVELRFDDENYERFFRNENFMKIPFRNVEISLKDGIKFETIEKILNYFKNSVIHLKLKNLPLKNYEECYKILSGFLRLKTLMLDNCKIDHLDDDEYLPIIKTLEMVSFHKCNGNCFKIFINQPCLEKVKVRNDDYTWKGFSHKSFNFLVKTLPSLHCIVMLGAGTGSYFDFDEFPYRIKQLEAYSVTFHWYVGIKTSRTFFLNEQKGFLKKLKIHQLPFDFDGGKVLKFIIEEMELDEFYYGEIPLILNGKKQDVREFSASEIQIQSAFEMFRQFKSITRFQLILSNTDVSSDDIEAIINPQTSLFDNVNEFEVIDKSECRGLCGVFLGFYKNLKFVKKFYFRTNDRNINVILEESLREMKNVEDILITSKSPNVEQRFKIIKTFASNLKSLGVAKEFVNLARNSFNKNVNIYEA